MRSKCPRLVAAIYVHDRRLLPARGCSTLSDGNDWVPLGGEKGNVALQPENTVPPRNVHNQQKERDRKLAEGQEQAVEAAQVDFSGRDRMVRNIVTSWGAHFVFIVSGFVLPRVIDRSLGQEILGIWDFSWSLTSYLSLTQLGIGSSVNRHVAMYRATKDHARLNGAVSSVAWIQVTAALVAFAVTVVVTLLLPSWFSARLGHLTAEAQRVVFLLGLSVVVQIGCDSFAGVMTGCHRWDIHNGLNAGFYGLTVIAMLLALLGGSGLPTLAFITLVTRMMAEGTRIIVSHYVCPELRVRWQYVNRSQMREMLSFGGKNVIGEISMLFLYQTTSLLIVSYLGAGALALYARPRALVHHCSVFVDKFASVLTPTVGSLHAGGKEEELRVFFLRATEAGMYLALPLVLLLAVWGGILLQLWMGTQYANGQLLAVLAIGYLVSMNLSAIWTILRGIGKHGQVAMVRLGSSIIGAGLTFVVLGYFGQGLVVVALASIIPTSLVDGLYAPLYACRQLGVPFRNYAWRTWGRPLLYVAPFAGCLFAIRIFGIEPQPVPVLMSCCVGGAVLGFTYWRWILPDGVRDTVRARVASFL